jgi:hypothetical protein
MNFLVKSKFITRVICVSMMFVLSCFIFAGCGGKPAPKVVAIKTAETLYIDDTGIALPEIKLQYDNGTEKTAAASDFWFNGEYTYVQDNKIFVKQTAPFIFEDDLEIIYRSDKNIKTTLHIVKQYVPLESIAISTENGETTCKQGETLQLSVAFMPINASDRKVVYEIIQGSEYAAVDGDGLLTINEDAVIDSVIQIKATAEHGNLPTGIEDDIDISNIICITVEKSYDVITVSAATESVYVPDKDDFAFYGYYTGKNGTGTKYFDYNGELVDTITEETKLYGYWVATTAVICIDDGADKYIDSDSHTHTNYYDIGLNVAVLQKLGYIGVKVAYNVELRDHKTAVDFNGDYEIWLDVGSSAGVARSSVRTSGTVAIDSWTSISGATEYIYFSDGKISAISQCRIGMRQLTHGNAWWFNAADVTFTALKRIE